jgi:pimeloyl-ACP methyl ester carboxylesterase
MSVQFPKTSGLTRAIAFALFACAAPALANENAMSSKPTTIAVRDVGVIEGVEYTLKVPENRGADETRQIELRFVVLPALQPAGAPPVIYLAGGPGGSATGAARSQRWPLFEALRQNRDVILLDQRGTGRSYAPPPCISSSGWSAQDVGDRATFVTKQREALRQCAAFWTMEGVDLAGYTTAESAADVAAVAEALGGKVSLLGISYGTHLALATLKAHPEIVDRAILVSVEGVDQTVKLPARTDAYFARLQEALDTNAIAAGRAPYPDLAAALRKALARIEQDRPVVEMFVARERPPVRRTLGSFAVQRAIAYALADPDRAHDVARGILAMAADEPDYSFMAFWGSLMPERIELRAMPTIMDLASGISSERLQQVESQAETALLGDAVSFPMPHLNAEGRAYRLPDSFRKAPTGDKPVMIVAGTLDGRTYPESAMEATAGFSQRAFLTVANAGHNLFLSHPQIVPDLVRFLDGLPVDSRLIAADLPSLSQQAPR